MGAKTTEMLELLEVPYEVLEPDNLGPALDRLLTRMKERSAPGALLVRGGVFQ
jgi:hypothetical protein